MREVRRALLVCAVVVAVTTSPASAQVAEAPEVLHGADTAGRIAFVASDGRPAIVDPVSGARAMLTSAAQRAQFPAWSPDGSALAVISSAAATGPGVDVYQPLSGEHERVYARAAEPPIYHSWSPDGSRIAVLARRVDALGLYLAPVPAGEPRLLAQGDPFYWSWADGGAALLIHRNVLRANAEIGFTRLDAYALDIAYPNPGAFQSPAVSASGDWVAYATRAPVDTRRVVLQRITPGGAGEERLELPHAGLAAFAWHPGRDLVAVQRALVAGPSSYGPIVTIDTRSGEHRTITDDISLAFWWSPDGGTIAYLTPIVADVPGPVRHVMLPALSHGVWLALWVADVATGFKRELARFSPSEAFLHQYLPFFDQYARSHRLWSPSSDALVLPVLDAHGESLLMVYGLDGSARALGPGDMPAWNVR